MSNRRLIPLGLGAVALLAVVALAARGGSLHSSGGGSGPSVPFWNYAYTTLLVLMIFGVIAAVGGLALIRPGDLDTGAGARKSSPRRTLRTLISLLAFSALIFIVFRLLHGHRNLNTGKLPGLPNLPGGVTNGQHASRPVTVQWAELVVVLALVAAVVAAYVVQRKRLGQSRQSPRTAPETVAAALDESLDDLRTDPDLRRAIVAAYARMERALAVVGMPRDPAEAPLEYLERVLRSLDASADAVRRLTDLFEWARFSHHEPEASMRDEAVDALIAVRDELRNAVRQAA